MIPADLYEHRYLNHNLSLWIYKFESNSHIDSLFRVSYIYTLFLFFFFLIIRPPPRSPLFPTPPLSDPTPPPPPGPPPPLRGPPLVSRARELEHELGFTHSSPPEVGQLLHLLAAQRGRARVGELGTGC